jgi:DNA-binding LacI/PurR family transcriptional regulator
VEAVPWNRFHLDRIDARGCAMVTIDDVAAQAGVGVGTVSRVLNDSPKVSGPTRERVLQAMAALDYRPNPLARGLSRGRSHSIGAVVPFFTHSSAVERLRGVVAGLGSAGYDLVLFDVESPEHRAEHLAALTRRDRAAGLLVISLPPPADEIERLVAAGVPVVLVDARCAGVPTVVTDDVHGGRLASQHLVDLGHRRIAFLGEPPDNPFGFTATAQREQGYRSVLADAGVELDESLVRYCEHDRQLARSVGTDLLQRRDRPTAIFASSDVQAAGVLLAAGDLGLDVPGDVSVIGFDDIEISSYAQLTTVRQPLFESGRLGAELLLARLDVVPPGVEAAPVHELPLELVVRSTTGRAPRPRRGRVRG